MVKWAKVWSSRSRRLDTSCTERQNGRPRATKGKAQPRGPWPVSAVTTYWSLPGTSYSRRYCPPCPETHPCRVGWENGVSSLRRFGQCPSFFRIFIHYDKRHDAEPEAGELDALGVAHTLTSFMHPSHLRTRISSCATRNLDRPVAVIADADQIATSPPVRASPVVARSIFPACLMRERAVPSSELWLVLVV